MKNQAIKISCCALAFAVTFFVLVWHKKHQITTVEKPAAIQRPVIEEHHPSSLVVPEVIAKPTAKPDLIAVEPEWTKYPPLRGGEITTIQSDIENHISSQGFPTYRESDISTDCHEIEHGISSEARQKFANMGKINAFYCFKDRLAIIKEPNITIQQVASAVPQSLRGQVFNLYLVQQAASWGGTPLYLEDEHHAYLSGSYGAIDLAEKGMWHNGQRADTVQFMLEFNCYMIVEAEIIRKSDPNYDDKQFKSYLMWILDLSMHLYDEAKTKYPDFHNTQQDIYWNTFCTHQDASSLRDFAKSYFGVEWCKKVLQF